MEFGGLGSSKDVVGDVDDNDDLQSMDYSFDELRNIDSSSNEDRNSKRIKYPIFSEIDM